ncbi:uncharacterized protein LOC107363512 isoform X2 [Tetranychus urticae]|uniref:NADH dehydrogenase [ubiquinone] 1 subunit C2 n=1 Tax=Tetranychus urticae TaxID=32264 RepID=T1KET4_TETUR|nr:uncharacterized protein LOC107363512 isoform X1 [Tetranychus urticae]XP_025016875.1 uncharacterized protein LOC107363512 isoform X2 [Tetranychus urticae]
MAETIDDDYAYCPNWREAHYNMARLGPRYHPLDVFTKFDDHRKPIDKYIYGTGVGAACGFSAMAIGQYASGKPVFSQIYRHAAGILIGFIGGYFVVKYSIKRATLEQSRLMHYIQSRPEYFPPIDRYKYKDTLGAHRLVRILR